MRSEATRVYSAAMKSNRLLPILLGILIVEGGTLALNRESVAASAYGTFRVGFLILMPVGLAALVWQSARWAPMVCVMYGTVGLALDLATVVQMIAKSQDGWSDFFAAGISGILNFLLIVYGGKALLDVERRPSPPGYHPPSPPPPF